ncbi:magnesium transporter [Lachnospiraceae bacterium DSM 108991]|uniref:Magnesium transporter MgtE n=1 Tax=Claveliimonas monacensis TaxID=2779351 RepID=A0ABR9RGR2_9FIRM|nr:magnesium transporter [Claveliimonas monacensis]MBE5062159.1 magnesium transporter [Claveliimonas monacensis]
MEKNDEREEYTYDNEEREELTEERILQMLDERKFKELKEELENNMYPVDLAELMKDFTQKQLVMVFRLLAKEEAAETFAEMDSDMREMLIGGLTDSELEEVMEEMYLDDTVDVLEEMPANVVDRLLMATDEETRQQINQLLQYPEDSAGSVMNVDYIALRKEMTVADSILKIRQVGLNKETIYTCYVTEKRKLIGMVDVKELLTTSESKTIEEIMDTNLLYAHTTDDQEEVAQIISKYDLIALPIVDHEMCMVGIVTVDDAMEVLEEETTEDISIMAGVNPSDDSYFETSVLEHVKSRLPWLLFLMLSATVTQMIMNHYESALAVMPQLAGFIPMLTGTGGNCGSQSSTLVIRGISVGEIEFGDLFKVIFKEVRVAVLISLILSVVNGIRIIIMGQGDVMIAVTIGLTMACTIVIAKVVGCTLPLLAEKVGLDPAIMATPLISTLVDISTISVYFAIVSAVFSL